MMPLWIASILALIQGITEFLPVSSSGHLVIAEALLGRTEGDLALDVFLHVGTAVAIFIVFRKDIIGLIGGVLSKEKVRRKASFKYLSFILIGSIPAGLAGLFFKDFFEKMFLDPRITAAMFIVTALFLFASRFRKKGDAPIGGKESILIGTAQALAILPGLSRSGTTISTALLLGINRKEAGRFSFLLGLPAILGAAALELKHIPSLSIAPGVLLTSFVISVAVGVLSLKLLLRFINHGKFSYFGFYLLVLGLTCLIFL